MHNLNEGKSKEKGGGHHL